MADSTRPQNLEEVCTVYAKAFAGDLEALVGVKVKLGRPEVATAAPGGIALDSDPIALTRCRNKNDDEQTYFWVVSRALAVTLGGMLMGYPEESMKESRAQPMDEELLDAFGEVMNLGTAVMSRLFTDDYNLPPVGVVETSQIEKPKADVAWLEGEAFAVARFEFELEGFEDSTLTVAFPPSAAHHWFGYAIGPYGRASKAASVASGEIEPTSVVFIEPDEETRNDIEDLEDDFVHSIWTIDPDEFDPDELTEFADVGAFFIEWDLDTRTGLDFLECLRGDEITRGAAIVMMSTDPTEAKVRTAIRSGADSFIAKPFETVELDGRLNPLLAQRQQSES
ncbi:MAG: hypothetical protein QF570_09555 [Myxococcota bacterium]|nr:hypothetical protein [Myxococcota bacterium]